MCGHQSRIPEQWKTDFFNPDVSGQAVILLMSGMPEQKEIVCTFNANYLMSFLIQFFLCAKLEPLPAFSSDKSVQVLN